MLTRVSARRLESRLTRVRHFSDAPVPHYHSKVTAIPFAFNTHEAIEDVSLHAATLAMESSHLFMSVVKRLFPNLDYHGFKPIKIEPIYFPTWVVDAEIVASKTYVPTTVDDTDKSVETIATINGRAMYYPGYSLFPLSLITLPAAEVISTAHPWKPAMANLSDSTNVTCLPYTRSPLSIPEIAKSMSPEEWKVRDRFRFEPESIRFPVIGPVYPVLVPIYLMQYETTEFTQQLEPKPSRMTIILEAHKRGGAIYAEESTSALSAENLFLNAKGFWNEFYTARMGYHAKIPLAFPSQRSSVPHLTVYRQQPRPRLSDLWLTTTRAASNWASVGSKGRLTVLEYLFRRWVNDKMLAAELALVSTSSRPETIDWDDLRVREATTWELVSNALYWRHRAEWTLLKNQVAAAQDKKYLSGVQSSASWDDHTDSDRQGPAEACAEAEKQVKSSKPEWLKEWEKLQEIEKRKSKGPAVEWDKRWKPVVVNKDSTQAEVKSLRKDPSQ